MATKYGFTALKQNTSVGGGNNQVNPTPWDSFKLGRVVEVSLNPEKPTELGYIKYVDVTATPSDILSYDENRVYPIAKPLYPNVTNAPLINEVVLLVTQPDAGINKNLNSISTYYISVISLWNHPHHNALPSQEGNIAPSQNKTYEQTILGSTVKNQTQSTEITFGKTFREKANIHPLLPFEGDIIYQGRWGNSIRFGSTVCASYEKTERKPINRTYSNIEYFTTGNTSLPEDIKLKLTVINSQVEKFKTQYPDYAISIEIVGSESRVPNPKSIPSGELAKLRTSELVNLLQNYSLLHDNINVSTLLGKTAYIQGTDNPQDPKYTNEQYVSIKIYLQAFETITKTINTDALNNWSDVGNNGDPITIFRNGQPLSASNYGYESIVENINEDLSSIWMTSTQQLPISASNTSYFSYPTDNTPIDPNLYAGNQIVINSGRLLFNSTSDHLLLSSAKSINLGAVESVNIDSPIFTIQSEKVLLGSKNAKQSVLLGDRTVDTLNALINNLAGFLQVCSTLVSTPAGTPLIPLNAAANNLNTELLKIQSNLEKLKSEYVKTI